MPSKDRKAADAQSQIDNEAILRDLREANANLVLANLRSIALANEVRRLYEEATDANEAKDAFFEQVSHELRTPLTSISGWAALLGIEPAPETIHEAARSIAGSAAVQARLINDLLDVSRITARSFDIAKEPVDVQVVADEAITAMRPMAMTKGISLSADMVSGISIEGDAMRLRQVFDNFLSNALKFTPSGGVVEALLVRDGDDAVFTIRDNGEGIPADLLPQMFKRHAQAKTGRFGGLGLGLSIVKHIIELHGGSVKAESEGPGKGSCFTVRIPGVLPASD
ncbi:MAG: sensor histidine kinase [Thermoanaerobaculia bacterium]